MNVMTETQHLLWDAEDLNETVLEVSEETDTDTLEPEVTEETAEITAWDELPGVGNEQFPDLPMEDEQTLTE